MRSIRDDDLFTRLWTAGAEHKIIAAHFGVPLHHVAMTARALGLQPLGLMRQQVANRIIAEQRGAGHAQ